MTAATPAGLPRLRIGLLMYDDVELLDHAGPYEVFTTAQRMTTRADVQPAPACGFEVVSLAVVAGLVRARAGLRLLPDATLDAAPPLDVLIVPGGVVDRVRAGRAAPRRGCARWPRCALARSCSPTPGCWPPARAARRTGRIWPTCAVTTRRST